MNENSYSTEYTGFFSLKLVAWVYFAPLHPLHAQILKLKLQFSDNSSFISTVHLQNQITVG